MYMVHLLFYFWYPGKKYHYDLANSNDHLEDKDSNLNLVDKVEPTSNVEEMDTTSPSPQPAHQLIQAAELERTQDVAKTETQESQNKRITGEGGIQATDLVKTNLRLKSVKTDMSIFFLLALLLHAIGE